MVPKKEFSGQSSSAGMSLRNSSFGGFFWALKGAGFRSLGFRV